MFFPLASFFVTGLASLSVSKVAGENPATVPHPNCTVSVSGGLLACSVGNYNIPGNFDLSLVPQAITNMRLGSLTNAFGSTVRPERLSTIHDNAPPLNLTKLSQLALFSFQGTNGKRLPIETFLGNVKGTLTRLELRACPISTLGPTFLQGFNKLAYLKLSRSDISAIDINAFETRVSLTDAALPVITSIGLEENAISTLDWAVFAPVAHSLQELYLHEQGGTTGLTTLTLSKPFTFAVLEDLELQENELNFPSRAILDTLSITSKSFIKFQMNAFCPDEQANTCSCCEAKDFVTWAHEIADRPNFAQKPAHLSFSCGDNGYNIFGNLATLPSKDQYNSCVAGGSSTTKRTTGTTTTKITTRTTKAVVDARSSTSATPGTRPNQLVGSSPAPSGSAWANRCATGLCGIALVVILFFKYNL